MVCRTVQEFTEVLLTNVLGTFSVTKSFLPLLKAGHKKVIVHISSNAASLSRNQNGIKEHGRTDASLALSYKASKVAVNMRTHQQAPCFHGCTVNFHASAAFTIASLQTRWEKSPMLQRSVALLR